MHFWNFDCLAFIKSFLTVKYQQFLSIDESMHSHYDVEGQQFLGTRQFFSSSELLSLISDIIITMERILEYQFWAAIGCSWNLLRIEKKKLRWESHCAKDVEIQQTNNLEWFQRICACWDHYAWIEEHASLLRHSGSYTCFCLAAFSGERCQDG